MQMVGDGFLLMLLTMSFWLSVVLFFVGVIAYAFFALNAIAFMKPGKTWMAWFPVWLVMPSLFEEQGNWYRLAALKVTVLLGVDLALVVLLANLAYE